MAVATKKNKTKDTAAALRIGPTLLTLAENASAIQGVSLTQFVSTAIAEKVERLDHEQWAANRKPSDEVGRLEALRLLSLGAHLPAEPGDELPQNFRSWEDREIDADKVRVRLAALRAG